MRVIDFVKLTRFEVASLRSLLVLRNTKYARRITTTGSIRNDEIILFQRLSTGGVDKMKIFLYDVNDFI